MAILVFIRATFLGGLFFTGAHAAVLKLDVMSPTFTEYPFREVCEKMGSKNFELIDVKSETEIDCMGKVYSASDFCESKFPNDKSLTRGLIDAKKKVVKCEHSDSVILSVSCEKEDAKYCLDPEQGCKDLRKIYAVKLDIAHYALAEKKSANNINCYFAKPL